MFGMSFYEIAIIAIVALVILGPEKLPEVARTAGKFLRQARQLSSTFRDTIMMEAELHEQKQKKKNTPSSSSTSSALISATSAATAAKASSGAEIGSFDLDQDYDGPLDQLHEDYFHMHPPDDVYTNNVDVDLEAHQMPDPFSTTEVELEVQLGEHAEPDEDAMARHLASPFDAHLVERHEVDLKAWRHAGARS